MLYYSHEYRDIDRLSISVQGGLCTKREMYSTPKNLLIFNGYIDILSLTHIPEKSIVLKQILDYKMLITWIIQPKGPSHDPKKRKGSFQMHIGSAKKTDTTWDLYKIYYL